MRMVYFTVFVLSMFILPSRLSQTLSTDITDGTADITSTVAGQNNLESEPEGSLDDLQESITSAQMEPQSTGGTNSSLNWSS